MKGILFNRSMYDSVISGEMTMTRRLIKPQPDFNGLHDHTKFPMSDHPSYTMDGFWGTVDETGESKQFKPRYLPGETVYLKEPYYDFGLGTILYKYRGDFVGDAHDSQNNMVWENPMFMPEIFARHFIEILSVKAERLQDISESEAILEGIGRWNAFYHANLFDGKTGQLLVHITPQQAFAALWDSINRKNKWDTNPFVWCYEFRLTK